MAHSQSPGQRVVLADHATVRLTSGRGSGVSLLLGHGELARTRSQVRNAQILEGVGRCG